MKDYMKSLNKYESLFYTSIDKSVLLIEWFDSKIFYILSNTEDNSIGIV